MTEERILVKGSRAQIQPYQSIPHISVLNNQRSSKWHGDTAWSLSDWGVALAGEVGEACNVIKKMNRVRDKLKQTKPGDEVGLKLKLAEELADSYLYLDLLATAAGIVLEDAIRYKFNLISEANGFSEKL